MKVTPTTSRAEVPCSLFHAKIFLQKISNTCMSNSLLSSSLNLLSSSMRRNLLTTQSLNFSLYTVLSGIPLFPWRPLPLPLVAGIDDEEEEAS